MNGMAVQEGILADRNRFADFVGRPVHSAFRGECFFPAGSASLFKVRS